MNPQYLMKSLQLKIENDRKTDNLATADCLEAIARCIRMIAQTDAVMGVVVWSMVKLARGEASWKVAAILEQIVRDIRLAASKKNEKSIVGVR